MLHYTFVILLTFIYYDYLSELIMEACMSYAVDLGSVVVGKNDTHLAECDKLKKNEKQRQLKWEIYLEKKKCFEDFLSGKSDICTDVSSMRKYFEAEFNKTAFCYPTYQELVKSQLHMRLDLFENVMKNGLMKTRIAEFFDNGGLECIQATKGPINEDCIFNQKGINRTNLENSILRQRVLFINQPTCSRGETILKCIEEKVNKTCINSASNMKFISSIHKPLQENCQAMIGITPPVPPPKKNLTGIIIGCLVAIIVVLLLTLFIIKKYGKRSDSQNRQSQSYNVSFQQNNDESRAKG